MGAVTELVIESLSLLEKAVALRKKLVAKVQGNRAKPSSVVSAMSKGLRR